MPPRRIVDQLNDEPDLEEERTNETEDDGDETELEAGPEDDDDDEGQDDGDDSETDDDDTTDDNDGEPEPPARQARQQRQPGRRENDVARLRRERREATERANALELELANSRRGGGNQPESEAVRNARLAGMEPNERVEFLFNEERAARQRERNEDRFREDDRRDRDLYNERTRTSARHKKHAGEVERRLNLLRAQGQNVPRESILKFIIGERVISGQSSPRVTQQRQQARQRVERETVTLPRGRGERGSQKGSKSADLEKRLANVPI